MALLLLVLGKRIFGEKSRQWPEGDLPAVTLLIAAYNEKDYILKKIENSISLNYPKDRLDIIVVADGSDDGTDEIVRRDGRVKLLHLPERKGKIAAIQRAMQYIKTEIVVFTDANTDVNQEAIFNIVKHFNNPKVGAVSGEKRILHNKTDKAISAGEGLYWRYESHLKKWDYELWTVVGAAGELFAVRTQLVYPVPSDTVIEDFYLTLKIAEHGFRVAYEPDAFAMETSSISIKEELKRKIRIAAGGIQAIARLKPLLNPLKHGVLTFQYVSHRVLRWTVAPFCLIILLTTNLILSFSDSFYGLLLGLQFMFYSAALIGYLLEERELRMKVFFIPYYFYIMNYAVLLGISRYLKGSQSVIWQRAQRMD